MTSSSEGKSEENSTKLVKLISWLLGKWSFFVADHAVFLIIICTVVTLIGTFKVATTPNENDITGYTPYGARARDEFDIMTDFFAQNGNGISIFLLILPKNAEENVLTREVLEEALEIENLISSNFTITSIEKKQENFRTFCTDFCQVNDPFVMFSKSYLTEGLSDRIVLNYPISTIYSRNVSIQPNFFGVEIENSGNGTSMKSAKMIALQLRSERKPGWDTQMIKDFEMEITNYFDLKYNSSNVRVLTLSTSFVEAEVVRAGMSLLPFLVVGFVIMAVISSVTTFFSALYMNQVSIHKFSLAIAACICPFMACGTGLGTLFFFGVRFGSILCVTPFLVLAIGVDDAYLMIHSWQRVTAERRKNPISDDSPGSRLKEVLIDTGPAILISALTNIFADVAGCFTSSPEISLLAYGNMACIFCDFLYQITFYSSIMTIAGKFEMQNEERNKNIKKITCGEDNEDQISNEMSFKKNVKEKVGNFLNFYIKVLTNWFFQILMITIWIVYLVIAIKGISTMNINLSPKKLFMEGSSLREMDDLRVKYVIPHYYVANVFVNQPGNLEREERLGKLDRFVEEMENFNSSWGKQGTNYFLRDFRLFQETLNEEEISNDDKNISKSLNIDSLPMFFNWPEYSFWRGFVKSHNDTNGKVVIDKFFITFAIHGDDLKEWPARGEALRRWREVVDKYRNEFGLSVYSEDGIYVDLIENMSTDTWQSAAATLSCMALICFIFMFDIPTVIITTLLIASIMTGILGILSLTGTDLDPIVMAALVISIGFSVDIPAHVSYHYHTSNSNDIRERMRLTLSSVGFPALQASLSTSLCVLALKFTSVYMSNVFVKTMILCMVLCVIHSLILLPSLFSVCHQIYQCVFSSFKKNRNEKVAGSK